MTDADCVDLLRDALEVEMLRLLTTVGPIRHNDEGFSIIRAAAEAAWSEVPEAHKADLRRRADEFVEAMSEALARRILSL